jgi:hypothetical protein
MLASIMSDEPHLDEMAFFEFGCQVTRYLHGIRERAELMTLLTTLRDIAAGTLTLVDSPEEVVAQLPEEQKALAARVPEVLRVMRAEERAAAERILLRIIAISEGEK